MSLRELVRTTFTTRDYAAALIAAWPEVTKEQAGVLWAQYALETGRGGSCWNYNIGNVKHFEGDGYDYVMLPNTPEIINGVRVIFQPPHPQTWFRAYDSLADAMEEHLEFLKKRYASAWHAVIEGNPAEFAQLIKARGYFTGSLDDYARALVSLHAEWMRSSAFDEARDEVADTEPTGVIVTIEGDIKKLSPLDSVVTGEGEDEA